MNTAFKMGNVKFHVCAGSSSFSVLTENVGHSTLYPELRKQPLASTRVSGIQGEGLDRLGVASC